MSEAEYLAFEEQAQEKHEFYDGIVRPLSRLVSMAGGSYEHSVVISNTLRAIGNRLEGSGCRALDSNIRVKPRQSTRYSYPDVTILCGEPEFDAEAGGRTTINNPLAVVEVLSQGTENFDRTKKLQRYQLIDSLREYVLIETNQAFVQTLFRDDNQQWVFSSSSGLHASVALRSLGIELPLAEIYRDIRLPPPPPESNTPSEATRVIEPE
jgi:Uma2 family endonuclease